MGSHAVPVAGPTTRGAPRTVPVDPGALGEGETVASLEAEVLRAEEERLLTAMRHLQASQAALAEEGGPEETEVIEENKGVISRMAARLVSLREALARLDPQGVGADQLPASTTVAGEGGPGAAGPKGGRTEEDPEVEVQPGVYVTMHGGRKLRGVVAPEGDAGEGVWL